MIHKIKKSKKQNNESIKLIIQAKQIVERLNFLSESINNLTELIINMMKNMIYKLLKKLTK